VLGLRGKDRGPCPLIPVIRGRAIIDSIEQFLKEFLKS